MIVNDANQTFFAGHLGSSNSTASFIYVEGDILVRCNGFRGNIGKFEDMVKATYSNVDNVFRRNYLSVINCARIIFNDRFHVDSEI